MNCGVYPYILRQICDCDLELNSWYEYLQNSHACRLCFFLSLVVYKLLIYQAPSFKHIYIHIYTYIYVRIEEYLWVFDTMGARNSSNPSTIGKCH